MRPVQTNRCGTINSTGRSSMRQLLLFCFGLIGLGIGGAVVAQTIGSVSNGYIEEGNLLRSGNIIKIITMSNRGQDASTCRAACDGNSDCNAYTYQQTAPDRKPQCVLRLIALPRGAKRDHGYTQAVSGTKLSYIPDVLGMTPHVGRAMTGGNIARTFKIVNEDPIACSDACSRDANCSGFTYAPRNVRAGRQVAQCNIYSQNGQLTSRQQAGYLSGSKGQISSPVIKPSVKPVTRPTRRPTISPQRRPVIDRKSGKQIIIPDTNSGVQGDKEQSFPGEMLSPEASDSSESGGSDAAADDQQFPGEMLQPEST